jgi:adenylate kinase family enzyme
MKKSEIRKLLNSAAMTNIAILFIGQSGAGKGTQMTRLKKLIDDLFIVGMGETFTKQFETFTPYHKERLKEIQQSGKRQSYVHATMLWAHAISTEHTGQPILIDGSPRSEDEANMMIEFFVNYLGRKLLVFSFDIDDREADKRMIKRNKADFKKTGKSRTDTDTPVKRANKILYYHTDVIPAIASMKGKDNVYVYEQDGTESIAKITTLISRMIVFHLKTF